MCASAYAHGTAADVWRQLAEVYDPELDEPVTDLGFIEGLEVDGGDVAVRFRLPTYWCAPNFAFIMARDIRDRLSRLSWVTQVRVHLVDHCTSEVINEGIAHDRSFDQVFPNEATGEVAELRLVFRRKAFMARQERLLQHLANAGWSTRALVALTIDELCEADLGVDGNRLRARYVAIREELGLRDDRRHRAITTVDDVPIGAESFDSYVRGLRKCRLNMEINTHFCRGLLQVRYGLPSDAPSHGDIATAARQPDAATPVRPEPLRWVGSRAGS